MRRPDFLVRTPKGDFGPKKLISCSIGASSEFRVRIGSRNSELGELFGASQFRVRNPSSNSELGTRDGWLRCR
jgi:hypothetical protein